MSSKTKAVRSIEYKVRMEVDGIVNFDKLENQKDAWNKMAYKFGSGMFKITTNNVVLGKAIYKMDGNGEIVERVPMIAYDCLRNNMFAEEMHQQMPAAMLSDDLLKFRLSHPANLERGHLFPERQLKHTGPLKIANAYCVGDEKGNMPFPTVAINSTSEPKSGVLQAGSTSDSTSEASLFAREVRGHAFYETEGYLDLRELQFISLSEAHDRLYCPSDWATDVGNMLGEHLGSKVPPPQFYQKKFDICGIPEWGILLTSEQVKFLAYDAFKRVARINIYKNTGRAKTIGVQVKFVYDPIEDMVASDCDDESKWIDVKSNTCKFNVNFLDNIDFAVGYDLPNQDKAKDTYQLVVKKAQETNEKDVEKNIKKKEEKEKKDKEKKEKKATKLVADTTKQ